MISVIIVQFNFFQEFKKINFKLKFNHNIKINFFVL